MSDEIEFNRHHISLSRENFETMIDDFLLMEDEELEKEIALLSHKLLIALAVVHRNCRGPIWQAILYKEPSIDPLGALAIMSQCFQMKILFGKDVIFFASGGSPK